MQLYKRGKYFWVRFTVDGIRHRVSTKEVTKTGAGARAVEIIQRVKDGAAPVHKRERVPTLAEFAAGWFDEWLRSNVRIADRTRDYYRYGLLLLKHQRVMGMRLDQITEEDADMIQIPNVSPSTHNNALRTLRRILHLAVRRNLIDKAPRIRLLEENTRTALIEPPTEAKITALLDQGRRSALRTALCLMLDAGMRPFEVSRMKIEDVSFERGLVFVPKSKTRAGARYLPLTSRMKEKLFVQIGDRASGWVFPSHKCSREGEPITPRSLTAAWRKLCVEAGLPSDLKLYCARHTFATDAMTATKNPFLVMKALGHTELSTTQRYQHHDIVELGEHMNVRNARRAERLLQ